MYFCKSKHRGKIDIVMQSDNTSAARYSQLAQLELLNAAANVSTQADLDALRLTLSLFFAGRAQQAIEKMWDEGTFDQQKLDELREQNLRTPHKTL